MKNWETISFLFSDDDSGKKPYLGFRILFGVRHRERDTRKK